MKILKCKKCNADLHIVENTGFATCSYCGATQVLPQLYQDEKEVFLERADFYRKNYEFDKAIDLYDEILNRFGEDAECYWSLVLCHYGIIYELDKVTGQLLPTINRMQYTSVYSDLNYHRALELADDDQKKIFEEEAQNIDGIFKKILQISEKEEPYDVFLCYKETDQFGRRTQDSVYANEIYHSLTKEGYRVFFARITLEDKLGKDYESYIFSALHSAKIMVVIATEPEYLESAWVKNEWMRFLKMIRKGEKKEMIPVYASFQALELPQELAYFNCMDIKELGFLDELIRGIKKIISPGKNVQTPVITNTTVQMIGNSGLFSVEELYKRGLIFLQDQKYAEAEVFFEDCLNINPQFGKAYLGKLLISRQINSIEKLQKRIFISDKSVLKKLTDEVYTEELVNKEFKKYIIPGKLDADKILSIVKNSNMIPLRKINENENLLLTDKEKHLLQHFIEFADADDRKNYQEFFEKISSSVNHINKMIDEINEEKGKNHDILLQELTEQLEYEASFYNKNRELRYQEAVLLASNNRKADLNRAMAIFLKLEDYKDSKALYEKCHSGLFLGKYYVSAGHFVDDPVLVEVDDEGDLSEEVSTNILGIMFCVIAGILLIAIFCIL